MDLMEQDNIARMVKVVVYLLIESLEGVVHRPSVFDTSLSADFRVQDQSIYILY
jgi:hypothetical protein